MKKMCLPTALRPPPRYVFNHRGDTIKSCLHLECTFTRKCPLRDVLCFLHHTQNKLRVKQEPSHLDTFCEGSYLHVEKTTH